MNTLRLLQLSLYLGLTLCAAPKVQAKAPAPSWVVSVPKPRESLPRLGPLLERGGMLIPELSPARIQRMFEALGIDPLDPRALEALGLDSNAPLLAWADDEGVVLAATVKNSGSVESALEEAARGPRKSQLLLLRKAPEFGFVAGPANNPRLVGVLVKSRLFLAPRSSPFPVAPERESAQANLLTQALAKRVRAVPRPPKSLSTRPADAVILARGLERTRELRAALFVESDALTLEAEALPAEGLAAAELFARAPARRLLAPTELSAVLSLSAHLSRASVMRVAREHGAGASANLLSGEVEAVLLRDGALVLAAALSENARPKAVEALLEAARAQGLEAKALEGRPALVVAWSSPEGSSLGKRWSAQPRSGPKESAPFTLELEPSQLLGALSGRSALRAEPRLGAAELAVLRLTYGNLLSEFGPARLELRPNGRALRIHARLAFRPLR